MPGWKLFMTRPSGFCQRSLRRYSVNTESCHLNGYHNAEAVIVPQFLAGPALEEGIFPDPQTKTDPRWPKACRCGYSFHPEDHWQVNVDRLYSGALDERLYRLRELPPGAVWRATWMEDIKNNPYASPKGEVWAVQLPCMTEWLVYSKPTNGGGWDIQGELPMITVSPSILLVGHDYKGYHGYIREGVISEDVEGRLFQGLPRTA